MNLPLYTQYLPTLSRAITAENPNGLPGKGGRASSKLGQGRKGSPCISITAGESVEIARIDGPGVIRHLWFTMPTRTAKNPFVLRNLRLRITWDSSPRAAIDVPIGDFFGCGFGETVVFFFCGNGFGSNRRLKLLFRNAVQKRSSCRDCKRT